MEDTVDDGPRRKQVKTTHREKKIPEPVQPPCIVRDGMYSRQQVLQNCRISTKTLATWIRTGLDAHDPHTSRQFFIGDEIIEYMKSETARIKKRKSGAAPA